jgi:Ca2+-binding EF-hand superfamily protein
MRMELVERIFIILDQDNDGVIDFNEMKSIYSAKRHPDVT